MDRSGNRKDICRTTNFENAISYVQLSIETPNIVPTLLEIVRFIKGRDTKRCCLISSPLSLFACSIWRPFRAWAWVSHSRLGRRRSGRGCWAVRIRRNEFRVWYACCKKGVIKLLVVVWLRSDWGVGSDCFSGILIANDGKSFAFFHSFSNGFHTCRWRIN